MTDKQKLTQWRLMDCMKTQKDLLYYLWAAVDEKDAEAIIGAAKDCVAIAKEKGWIK